MRIAELAGRRVAVWGYGREGRAAIAALRARLPALSLTLFCNADEAAQVRAGDTIPTQTLPLKGRASEPAQQEPSSSRAGHLQREPSPSRGGQGGDGVASASILDIRTTPPDADALAAFDVVIKSPGISAYRPELVEARRRGTVFTSGTALWFAENPDARVVAVTGTKGKSTTAAMIAHLARSLGVRTALAGNIGLPLLGLLDQRADLWVIELSSFQTGEAGPLELGVVTSLYEEHLDWHGSRERYVADKLKLADVSCTLLVNATQPRLLELTAAHPRRALFGDARGWHVAPASFLRRRESSALMDALDESPDSRLRGNDAHEPHAICRGDEAILPLSALPVPGAHNALNACAALAALELLGLDAPAAAHALSTFTPLPHRLQALGERDGVRWIDDSISTTPEATLAALASLDAATTSVIVGGFDRGLDWSHFAAEMHRRAPYAVITQGANGARIAEALRACGVTCPMRECAGIDDAVVLARGLTPPGGFVLLSPGAPSFDQFKDYAARGRRFADLAGFEGAEIGTISGLGIA